KVEEWVEQLEPVAFPLFGFYIHDEAGDTYVPTQEPSPGDPHHEWRGLVRIAPKPAPEITELTILITGLHWIASRQGGKAREHFFTKGTWQFQVPLVTS
ncbi:MAG: hypothetical protein ACRDIB_18275, partial [Ardenticatenaceae bacterium]